MSSKWEPLSEHLLEIAIDDAARYPRTVSAPRAGDSDLAEAVRDLVGNFLASKESVTGDDWSTARHSLDELLSTLDTDLENDVNWHITRALLQRVPSYVDRTLKLAELVGRPTTPRVASYLREATQCYIYGLFQASIALARAAIEQALKERVYNITGPSHTKLPDLIEEARKLGVLDAPHSEAATFVMLRGNELLHGDPTSPDRARDCLERARGVLEHLFVDGVGQL